MLARTEPRPPTPGAETGRYIGLLGGGGESDRMGVGRVVVSEEVLCEVRAR